MELKLLQCAMCGKTVAVIKETDVPVFCCGKPMRELIPGSVDTSKEKHVPVYEVRDGYVYVTVGSEAHPMTSAHHIEWIALETRNGNQRKCLSEGAAPNARFRIDDGDVVLHVYAYCNLHALWKA